MTFHFTRSKSVLTACATGLAALSLTACDSAETAEENTELNEATTTSEANALANAIEPLDYADLRLGAKIEGPQGPDVKTAFSNAAGNFADITSYVTCPDGMATCDPATAPEGTIYTYVHIVYPGEDNDAATGSGSGNDSSDVERATAFYMTQAAHGFTGQAGYSHGEVLASVGEKANVTITCDAGKLAWSINAGGGGDQWEQAEPVTFWWQSTLPPAGPSEAYAFDADGTTATASGPYPAPVDGVRNACDTL